MCFMLSFFDENKILHTIHSSFLPSYMYTLHAHTANFFGEPSSSSSLFSRRDSRSSALSPSGRRSSSSPKLIHTYILFVETSSGKKVVTHFSSVVSCVGVPAVVRLDARRTERTLNTEEDVESKNPRKEDNDSNEQHRFWFATAHTEGLFAVTA